MTTISSNATPEVAPLTFMGVPRCGNIGTIDADVAIMGVSCATPYLQSEAYGLANLSGPTALRRASVPLLRLRDRHDWDLDGVFLPDANGRVVDIGDLPVSFHEAETNRQIIRQTVEQLAARNTAVIALGGEDSVPTPMLQGLSRYEDVTVLQIDAHMDWRDENLGERWGLSSGMRRASEMSFVKDIIQVGTRGPSSAGDVEVNDARNWGAKIFTGEDVFDRGVQPIIDSVREGTNVHVNFDLDGLDPTIMPAVWVPSPGGLSFWHAIKLIRGIARKANIVSVAMVEYVEARDPAGLAANVAVRLTTAFISEILRQRQAAR
ncbi:Guanidinobutyrase [Paraburkholderia sediminicola]|uniref:Guanidinobutyrase n=1 Tax=Paraburkholderia sediminicola TaxID=458836 RepID=A0A6J5CVP2_9BURK|nr:arginase family protein [Paraburkholderia sediminicola]CAB3745576.1 Guanidinobutyrase [Paraburkholderia sediminicola]